MEISSKTPVTIDLWFELNKNLHKRITAFQNICRQNYDTRLNKENDWFSDYTILNTELKNQSLIYASKYVKIMDKIYNQLTNREKYIIDKYKAKIKRKYAKEFYEDFKHEDTGNGIPLNNGTYVQSDGTIK
jgi:PHD/YefM family antitoxin component YafN of YafNO toxin-antitoxin module